MCRTNFFVQGRASDHPHAACGGRQGACQSRLRIRTAPKFFFSRCSRPATFSASAARDYFALRSCRKICFAIERPFGVKKTWLRTGSAGVTFDGDKTESRPAVPGAIANVPQISRHRRAVNTHRARIGIDAFAFVGSNHQETGHKRQRHRTAQIGQGFERPDKGLSRPSVALRQGKIGGRRFNRRRNAR